MGKSVHRRRSRPAERRGGRSEGTGPPDGDGPQPGAWRRTLIVVWITEFIALIGFSMVIPFLPLYVQELGVTDESQVKLWSGLLLSGHAITMGIFSPIWGGLADRYGRKLMLGRATFGAALVMTLMAWARTPEQLLILRIAQGCLTGTVAAATTLIASVVPRERTGYALGLLQMGMYAGVSMGPLAGGVIADTLGYRYSFLFTGVCLFLAALGVVFFVHEDFQRPQPEAGAGRRRWGASLAAILRARDTMAVLLVRLVTRTATRIISPVLPLFVAALLPETSALGAATMTGIVTAANSAATSIGAAVLGRTGDRVGHRRVLLASAAGTSVLYALQVVVTNTAQLTLLQFFLGVALAGTLSTMAALLAKSAPEGQHGTVFGLDSSIVSVANALGPMIGAATAVSYGNRATFLLAGGGFALATVIAAWLMPRS